MESSLSQTVFHEGLLSDFFSCLSGRRIVVVETMNIGPVSLDDSWGFVSFAPVGELGFSYLAGGRFGELLLNEAALASISQKIGIQTRRTEGFTLLRPMYQRLYRIYEDRGSQNLDKLGDMQIAVIGRELKYLYERYNRLTLIRWIKIKVGISAKFNLSGGEVKSGKVVQCSIFLQVNNQKEKEVKMVGEGECISLQMIESADQEDDLQLEVSLGAISMSLEELLRLREGSRISVKIQKNLKGYLGLGADSFAEVELRFGDDAMAIEIKNVLL